MYFSFAFLLLSMICEVSESKLRSQSPRSKGHISGRKCAEISNSKTWTPSDSPDSISTPMGSHYFFLSQGNNRIKVKDY